MITYGVELVTKPGLVSTSDQARSGGATKRRRDVTVRKSYAFGRNRVDVRRWNLAIPLATQFPVTQIIGQKDHDVRFGEIAFVGVRLAKHYYR